MAWQAILGHFQLLGTIGRISAVTSAPPPDPGPTPTPEPASCALLVLGVSILFVRLRLASPASRNESAGQAPAVSEFNPQDRLGCAPPSSSYLQKGRNR